MEYTIEQLFDPEIQAQIREGALQEVIAAMEEMENNE